MWLEKAHAWYAYQDRLSAFFILDEILKDRKSTFVFDNKEYLEDKFDDLTIENNDWIFKKQFKYSNWIELKKSYLSSNSWWYDLWLDSLFDSYINHTDKERLKELRICTTWEEPSSTNDILNFISLDTINKQTFPWTKIYQINLDSIWNIESGVNSSWRKLKSYIDSHKISRDDFGSFLQILLIEINLPDFSLNSNKPWELEETLKKQLTRIGIWTHPNDKITQDEALLRLVEFTTNKRANIGKDINKNISINEILKYIRIEQNFWSIEQEFPIVEEKNIINDKFSNELLIKLKSSNKIFVKGEPWAWKSWFLQNFQKFLNEKSINFARHYCHISLEDSLSSKRIQTNIFFWNLINDIIKQFPNLKEYKEKLYSSDLNELNILLSHIDEDFILLIDWLDHIQRISKLDSSISSLEIDIIENLKKIKLSNRVKIIVFSQPLDLEMDDFEVVTLPSWDKEWVISYLEKIKLTFDSDFIELILDKSKWNALYINYIVNEYQNGSNLNELPEYDFNLRNYYNHLLCWTSINNTVIYTLVWADFRLTKSEIWEITAIWDYVDDTLGYISAILNTDFSKGWFIIYHESFRRFIIEILEEKKVWITKVLYEPIIIWLKSKWFFEFTKSYRNLLPLLIKTSKFSEWLTYLNKEFITNSLYNWYNQTLIESNHKLLAKCVVEEKDFEKLIFILENSRILATVLQDYEFSFNKYIEALSCIKWYDKIKEFLEYEWKPTVSYIKWLNTCYLLDINNQNAPWNLYLDKAKDFFENNEASQDEYDTYFKCLIRYLISTQNKKRLASIAHKVLKSWYKKHIYIFKNELVYFGSESLTNSSFVDESLKIKSIKDLMDLSETLSSDSIFDIAKEILNKDIFFDSDLDLLKNFFLKINDLLHENKKEDIEKIILDFSGINWFYNWCIYYINILVIINNSEDFDIKQAFEYLILDLEPFKWKPRVMDLYWIEPFVLDSIDKGLWLVKENEWKEILEILGKVTEKTTTYLTNIAWWPLTPWKKMSLLKKYLNPINQELILPSLKEDVNTNTKIYSELADANFDLCIYHNKSWFIQESDNYFKKALLYSISNWYRKDTTLDELIEPLSDIYRIDDKLWIKYIPEIEKLTWTVPSHTEWWKWIKWLPLNWYKQYLQISIKDSMVYLLNEMLSTESWYFWLWEEMLAELLIKINSTIDPISELFLIKSFLNSNNSEKFLNYALNVFEKTLLVDEKISIDFLSIILNQSNIREYWNPRNDSEWFCNRLSELSKNFWLEINETLENKNPLEYRDYEKLSLHEIINKNIWVSNICSVMNNKELIEDILENNFIPESKLSVLYYIINFTDFDDSSKELVDTLVARNFWRYDIYQKKYNTLDLDKIFIPWTEQYFFYKICLFNNKSWGWGEWFIDTDSFVEAWNIDFERARIDLFKFSSEKYFRIGIPFWMASNLIKAISRIDSKKQLTLGMYKNLYDIISYRIPDLIESNWEESTNNDLDLNEKELLVCLLFVRLRIWSSERFHIGISWITYLLYFDKNVLIKPLKWFFRNSNKFLYLDKQIILEVLLDYVNKVDEEYLSNFKDELTDIFPSWEYTVDYIINYLTNNGEKTFGRVI